VTRAVPRPLGGTVYQQWRISHPSQNGRPSQAGRQSQDELPALAENSHQDEPDSPGDEIHVGNLGSGSDFTPFFQHAGVPSTDIGSEGPYGVYHSVFDNYAWYVLNADPHFLYLQQMARVFGLEALRMADADVLPYDYAAYARAIGSYLEAVRRKSGVPSDRSSSLGWKSGVPSDRSSSLGWKAADAGISLDFATAQAAAARFMAAAERVRKAQTAARGDLTRLNLALRQAENGLLTEAGLPNRPWYRHTIFAPGEYTGYAPVVLPGVNEALDAHDPHRAAEQLAVLTQALIRAAQTLEGAR